MKTYKEIINLVLTGLLTNNSVCNAENDALTCLYRSEDGMNACLVGRLIEDEHYVDNCEEVGVADVPAWDPNFEPENMNDTKYLSKALHLSGINLDDILIKRFLKNLQIFHDEKGESNSPIIDTVSDIEWLYDECIALDKVVTFNRHNFDTLWERVTGRTMESENTYTLRTNLV